MYCLMRSSIQSSPTSGSQDKGLILAKVMSALGYVFHEISKLLLGILISFICGSVHHSFPSISKPSHKSIISPHFLCKGVAPSHVHTSPIPRKFFVVLLSAFDPSNLNVERGMSHTSALNELLNSQMERPGLLSLPTGNIHLDSTF